MHAARSSKKKFEFIDFFLQSNGNNEDKNLCKSGYENVLKQ